MKKKLFMLFVFALLCSGCTRQIQTDDITSGDQVTPLIDTPTKSEIPLQTTTPEKTITSSDLSNNNGLLQEIISTTTTTSNTTINIDEDSCYLISTDIWSGYKNSIVLVDHTGQIIHTFHDIMGLNLNYGVISKKDPLVLGISNYNKEVDTTTDSNFLYGLYLPETDSFIVEPQYDYIAQYSPNLYTGLKGYNNVFFDQNGTILSNEISVHDYYIQLIGSFLWMFPNNKNNALVYNLDFERIAEIDCSNSYCYSYGNEYIIYSTQIDNSDFYETKLLDETGNIILSKEILEAHGVLPSMEFAYIESIEYHTKSGLFQIYYGPYRILIDKEYRIIETINTMEHPNDYIIFDEDEYYIFTYNMKDSDIILHYPDGNPIMDSKGLTFTNSLGHNTVYRIDGNTIKIFKYLDNTEYSYTISGMTNPTIYSPFEDLYIIRYGNEPNPVKVFYKNSMILEKENYSWSYLYYDVEDNNYQILYPDTMNYSDPVTTNNIILNHKGEIVYTSPYEEAIYAIDDNYMVVERGNYIGLIDFNGNFVFYTLNPSLSDD